MIEDQNMEITAEWAKCFLCQKDTAETLLSPGKLRAIFKKLAGFAAIDEVPSHLLWINQSRKKTLNQPSKTITLNIIIVAQQTKVPTCLHEREANAGKFVRMIKITTR